MEEPPPPYPGYRPCHKDQHEQRTLLQDTDTELCIHPHQFLASTNAAWDTPSITLHHWDCFHGASSTTSSLAIPTNLNLDTLKFLQDFRELGTVFLPREETSDFRGIHKSLSLLLKAHSEENTPSLSDSDLLSHLLELLPNSPTPSNIVPLKLFSITVLSDNPGPIFADGPAAVWKWIKPESVYPQKWGRWVVNIERAIENGEWAAGKGLKMLVRGVTVERRGEIQRGERYISCAGLK